ncbi:MAG: CBS domain-containing protein [Pseudomonadales bacterium]|nr:CBS domain-containing protein [Pseudomonadales bacterium]
MKPNKVILAQDVMKPNFIEMDGLATVKQALERLREEGDKIIIINKRHEHDAHGLILLSDIAKKVLARDQAPDRVNLYEIMSKPMLTVPSDMDVRYCARLFDRFGLSVAPVLNDDKVVGVVSYSELVLHGLCELVE